MQRALMNKKVAVLVANGFEQSDMLAVQKSLLELGANVRIVSPEQGLVTAWNGTDWGHNFAVDAVLNTALGADYDVLVIPGGQKSHNKLRLTAHTKRFVESFDNAMKPVVLVNDGVLLPVSMEIFTDRTLAGPQTMSDIIARSGAIHSTSDVSCDEHVMSGVTMKDGQDSFIKTMVSFLIGACGMMTEQQAAA